MLLTAVVIIMTHYYDNCLTDCGLEVSAERGKPQEGLILDLEQEVFFKLSQGLSDSNTAELVNFFQTLTITCSQHLCGDYF